MFAGWAILFQLSVLGVTLCEQMYITFGIELVVIAFIVISQRNAK